MNSPPTSFLDVLKSIYRYVIYNTEKLGPIDHMMLFCMAALFIAAILLFFVVECGIVDMSWAQQVNTKID